MKYTLLDLVQTIASSLDSDEVNSVTDTTESLQIAYVVRTVYMDLISRANLPEHYSLTSLVPSGDSLKPTLMYVPETVDELLWLKYDNRTVELPAMNMQPVQFVETKAFLEMLYQFDLTDTTRYGSFSHVIAGNTFTLPYRLDKAPQFYTTFDDRTLIFDSYDALVDTTLQASKTTAYAKLEIPFVMSDTFVPDLDSSQFQLLLNEAKSLAWAELKQAQNGKAEQAAKRQWTRLEKTKYETEHQSYFDRLPNYGRIR